MGRKGAMLLALSLFGERYIYPFHIAAHSVGYRFGDDLLWTRAFHGSSDSRKGCSGYGRRRVRLSSQTYMLFPV